MPSSDKPPLRDELTPPAEAAGELDQSSLDHLLGYRLALADVPVKRGFARHIGKPLNLRPAEFTLLLLVLENPSATQKMLAQALCMPPPNLTLLIDRMTERGLLTRVRSETDRRAQHLQATQEGAALANQARAVSQTMEADLLSVLSPGERTILFELLRKLARQRCG